MSNLYFDLSCYLDLVIWKTILSRGLKKWRWILVWGEIACGVVVSCGGDRRLLYCLCHKRAFLDRKENNDITQFSPIWCGYGKRRVFSYQTQKVLNSFKCPQTAAASGQCLITSENTITLFYESHSSNSTWFKVLHLKQLLNTEIVARCKVIRTETLSLHKQCQTTTN